MNKETTEYTEKLILAAGEFRLAISVENTAKKVYDNAKLDAKLAGTVYYDALDALNELVGA